MTKTLKDDIGIVKSQSLFKDKLEARNILYGEAASDLEGLEAKLNTYYQMRREGESLDDTMKRVSSAYRYKSPQYLKAKDEKFENVIETRANDKILDTIENFSPDEKWPYSHHENYNLPNYKGMNEDQIDERLRGKWGDEVDFKNKKKIGQEYYFPKKQKQELSLSDLNPFSVKSAEASTTALQDDVGIIDKNKSGGFALEDDVGILGTFEPVSPDFKKYFAQSLKETPERIIETIKQSPDTIKGFVKELEDKKLKGDIEAWKESNPELWKKMYGEKTTEQLYEESRQELKKANKQIDSLSMGALRGFTFGALPETQLESTLMEEYPAMYTVGSFGGAVGSYLMTGGILRTLGVATQAVRAGQASLAVSSLGPRFLPHMIMTGATFGTHTAISETVKQAKEGKLDLLELGAKVGKDTAFGALLGAIGKSQGYAKRVIAATGLGYASAKTDGADDPEALLHGGIWGMFELIGGRGRDKALKQEAIRNMKTQLSDYARKKYPDMSILEADGAANNFLATEARKLGGMNKVLESPENSLRFLEVVNQRIFQAAKKVKPVVAPKITTTVRNNPRPYPKQPKATIPQQFTNPNDPKMLDYLALHMTPKQVASLPPEKRLEAANMPLSELRELADKTKPPAIKDAEQTGKVVGIDADTGLPVIDTKKKEKPEEPTKPATISETETLEPTEAEEATEVTPAEEVKPAEQPKAEKENLPEVILDEYRKSTLPEYNTSKEMVEADAFVDKIREYDPKDEVDAIHIKHGAKYEVTVSYPHSLGENGNQTTFEYPDKPTTKEIQKDVLELYKEEKAEINKPLVAGIVAKSGRDENIEEKIDKVLASSKPDPLIEEAKKYKSAKELQDEFGLKKTETAQEWLDNVKSSKTLDEFLEAQPYATTTADQTKALKESYTDFWNKAHAEPPQKPPTKPPEKPKGGSAGASVAQSKAQSGYGTIGSAETASKPKRAKTDYSEVDKNLPKKNQTNLIREALKITAPATVTDATQKGANVLRKNLAELAHKDVVASEALRQAHKAFMWMSNTDAHEFIDNMENGRSQKTADLQRFSNMMNELLVERRKKVQNLGKGHLESFYENYFPHIWQDPNQAKNIILTILGKKRLEGSKSFLKKRVIMTVKDGLERGLKLVSDNPVDLILLKLHEMDRYIMSQQIIQEMKAKGLVKFVYARSQPPEGYSQINDYAFTVYMPPEITKKEAYDSVMVDQMMDIAKSLGIDTKRYVSIGHGGAWGLAYKYPEKVRTKYAGPESVLAHEIGHILGYRYHLYEVLGRRLEGETKVHQKGKKAGQEYFKHSKEAVEHRRKIDPQWRALADARKASPSYARKKEEKEAVMLEALIHAPEVFKKVAPDLYRAFVDFLNAHSELRPLLDVKPSLVLGESEAKIKVPGVTTLGHYYAPEDVARLINNHLSPGLKNNKNKLIAGSYNLLRGVGNILNQVNLAMSGFHALNVSTDMMASTLGLAFRKLGSRGQFVSGLKDLVSFPLSPVVNIWQGMRIKKAYLQQIDSIQDEKLKTMVQAIIVGGGRDRMDAFYYNHQLKALEKTFRNILKGSNAEQLIGIAKLPFNVFGATVEVLAKPIMQWYVPTGKIGLFAKLAEHEMIRAETGEITDEQLVDRLASVWDSVDNRMGQLIYDNLFWDKAMKDSLMLAIRSVGWNLGSWREYAGAGVDLLTANQRMKKGDKFLSQKMAYASGAAAVYAILGAIIMYLLTGKPPEEPKDYFFPKTGNKNPDGSDERLSLPTYAKDIYAYSQQPLTTVSHKAHPLIGLLNDTVVNNHDFFNVMIRDPKDPIFKQISDVAQYVVNYSKPFSFKNYEKMSRVSDDWKRNAMISITGINSAPAYVVRSPAQKLMYRIIAEQIPDKSRTKEDFERSEYRRSLKNRLRKGENINHNEAREILGKRSYNRLLKDAKLLPFAESYKRLSLKDALNVYAIANKEEREQAQDILESKYRRARDKTPAMKDMYDELMNAR